MRPPLKRLEEQIVAWAMGLPSVRAAIICGSTERRVNPGDEWADLDVEIYAADFDAFARDASWLKRFGTVWTYLQLQEEGGPVLLCVYEGGEKVDLHIFNVAELQRIVAARELHDSYQRGYRIVVDKDGLAAQLPPAPLAPAPAARPSAEEFDAEVRAFWYGVLYVAKQIRRRNLWVVKFRDWSSKQSLLKMLEWHAQAAHEWRHDTWHDGHFLSQWAGPEIWAALHATFGAFDAGSSWHALLATMELFDRLAIETAQRLGYRYSTELAGNVAGLVRSLYQADDLSARSGAASAPAGSK